jgi:hypothetical protein
MGLRIVISLNQALCRGAEVPRFVRLVLGGTLGDGDHYAAAITMWRANLLIKQLFRLDIEHRLASRKAIA